MYIGISAIIILFLISPELAILLGTILLVCHYPIILLIGFSLWVAFILLAVALKCCASFADLIKIDTLIERLIKKFNEFLDKHKIPDSILYIVAAIIFWIFFIAFLSMF